ncbi:MAG TPA: hypothetical protein VL173_00530, partial [Vicinamibacterales bacterium]|nr:hypothetical protein [Vicinamibacterales bacterium]
MERGARSSGATVVCVVAVVVSLVASAIVRIDAQSSQPPVFDAVSIKVNDSGRDGGGSTALRNGRWNATNFPLVGLIGGAWGINTYDRVLDLPDWA